MSRKCLRCGEDSGNELYCYWCRKGYPPSYLKSKREKAWEKRMFAKLRRLCENQ